MQARPSSPPTVGRTVLRGVGKRCGRCGATGIFATYFRLRDHCPRCGYRFVREEGAFTGVMLMNIFATFLLMFLSLVSYVLWRGLTGDDELPFRPFAVAAVAWAAIVPLVFYPVAASWWAAIDLVMRPLDPDELAEAEARAAQTAVDSAVPATQASNSRT